METHEINGYQFSNTTLITNYVAARDALKQAGILRVEMLCNTTDLLSHALSKGQNRVIERPVTGRLKHNFHVKEC